MIKIYDKFESKEYNEGYNAFKNRPNHLYEEFMSNEFEQYQLNSNPYRKDSGGYKDSCSGLTLSKHILRIMLVATGK